MSCGETSYSPKPKGFPRTDFPERDYTSLQGDCPFSFEYPSYTVLSNAGPEGESCWLNIDYPFIKGRIHFSYKKINGNLNDYLEDARTLVYRHTIKADAIIEDEYIDRQKRVYARIYQLEGNAASAIQFFAMDSTNHFVRGALYFNARTNADSLKPAIDFVREDVFHLIKSLEWKEE